MGGNDSAARTSEQAADGSSSPEGAPTLTPLVAPLVSSRAVALVSGVCSDARTFMTSLDGWPCRDAALVNPFFVRSPPFGCLRCSDSPDRCLWSSRITDQTPATNSARVLIGRSEDVDRTGLLGEYSCLVCLPERSFAGLNSPPPGHPRGATTPEQKGSIHFRLLLRRDSPERFGDFVGELLGGPQDCKGKHLQCESGRKMARCQGPSGTRERAEALHHGFVNSKPVGQPCFVRRPAGPELGTEPRGCWFAGRSILRT